MQSLTAGYFFSGTFVKNLNYNMLKLLIAVLLLGATAAMLIKKYYRNSISNEDEFDMDGGLPGRRWRKIDKPSKINYNQKN